MNPAFAAAHGIRSSSKGEPHGGGGGGGGGNQHSLDIILKRAQDTGKLVASNCPDLTVPFPKEVFEFPFGLSRYTEDAVTVVDFSDNEDRLRDSLVDERILRYQSVQSLRFRNCGIKLPDTLSFSSLEHLAILDLSGNKLADRFDVGFLLCAPDIVSPLVELNLSNNQIREVVATSTTGADTVRLPNLRTLNLSHNKPLEKLFETGCSLSCGNLRIFRCHHNPNLHAPSSATQGDGLPSFLGSTKAALEVLEASHNPKMGLLSNGATVTIDLSGYEKLQTVNFAMNKFEKVPCISHSVKTVDLQSNKLNSLTGLFSHASSSQLVDLILADNYLTELDPLVIETMTKLKRLDLMCNKIRALPYQLGFLTELTSINISGNPVITRFSSSVANSSDPHALQEVLRKRAPAAGSTGAGSTDNRASSNLLTKALSTKGRTTLDLAQKSIEISTDDLEGLVGQLKAKPTIDQGITGQIILDSNRLESLPDELFTSCLPNVQTISLISNRFAELPPCLQASRSTSVRHLHLARNLLTADALHRASWFQPVAVSPPSLSQGWSLRSLTHLDLSSNKLTSFPIDTSSAVHCFPALEVLNLFNNKLSSLMDWKRLPESLAVLDLSENNIEDVVPLSIMLAGDCPNFQRLSLMHNKITLVPPSLGLLSEHAPNMVSLNLQGNPQKAIRSFVLEKPCGELLKYLFDRLTPGQRNAALELIKRHKQRKELEQANPVREESTTNGGNNEEADHTLLKELQESVETLKAELDNLSLTQAKKYALKKALAMERSKLIREERRLGLRK
jgi:Leucine-rich repeat (LRR) protein